MIASHRSREQVLGSLWYIFPATTGPGAKWLSLLDVKLNPPACQQGSAPGWYS